VHIASGIVHPPPLNLVDYVDYLVPLTPLNWPAGSRSRAERTSLIFTDLTRDCYSISAFALPLFDLLREAVLAPTSSGFGAKLVARDYKDSITIAYDRLLTK
jgi:hypothetical protein